jgi:SAM-dependent methyltransferase
MLKMYHQRAHKGDSPELWEENWENDNLEEALRFCETDPLRALFKRYARPGTSMLEGGCGHGQYVSYYAARGVQVIGLDFAQSALARLHARSQSLMLCAGDVAALPFRDGAFDLYYSGGVVEHFETGVDPALREARRVLRPGGVLLISVPYVSLLRRLLLPFKWSLWKPVSCAEADSERVGDGPKFFQYVYTRREFEKTLAVAGLRVIATQGYGILWGLYDVALFQTLVEKITQSNARGPSRLPVASPNESLSHTAVPESNGEVGASSELPGLNAESNATTSIPKSSSRSTIKRLIISEDDGLPVVGLGVRLMRWACANMMMYVCTPDLKFSRSR